MTDEQVLEQALRVLRTTCNERHGVLWSDHARVLLAEIERLHKAAAKWAMVERMGLGLRLGRALHGWYVDGTFSQEVVCPYCRAAIAVGDTAEEALQAAALGEGREEGE